MSNERRPRLKTLPSGVPRLDYVLGGGFPEYSLNVIAGEPGSGKTTLVHQVIFTNASIECPAVYFTILGEPSLKMLRYQQQFTFFDRAKVNESIHFINLGTETMTGDLQKVLDVIVSTVERLNPGIVVVDSFRSLAYARASQTTQSPSTQSHSTQSMDLQDFVQRVAMHLTGWQATTFMIGEYSDREMADNPIFTIADGIISLYQSMERNSMVRKLRVFKVRGQQTQPGFHTVRITADGVQVFPRLMKALGESTGSDVPNKMISVGVAGLDEMLGGGTKPGSSILVAGPAGTGKTCLALQFISEGVRNGEPGVMALFEETESKYVEQAQGLGVDIGEMSKKGLVEIVYARPLDLSVDEMLYAMEEAILRIGAKRVIIDSITGLEAALAPTFKEDFRESLYRLIGALTSSGVTLMMTVEQTESYNELRFTPHAISFLTHDVILQKYVEIEGELRTVMTVIKTRGRKHSREFREYTIGEEGIMVGEAMRDYNGIITGVPRRVRNNGPSSEG
jgi:circadian clock protein KaiC